MANADSTSSITSTVTPVIPRFALAYHQYARARGLKAEIVVKEYAGCPWPLRERVRGTALMLRCEGTRRQLRALGILSSAHDFRRGRRHFATPRGHGLVEHGVTGYGVLWLYLCGVPDRIETSESGAEMLLCGDLRFCHGTEAELSKLVAELNAELPDKHRDRKCCELGSSGPLCYIQRLPGGTYLVIHQTAEAWQRMKGDAMSALPSRVPETGGVEQARLPSYSTPAEWLERLEDWVCGAISAVFDKNTVRTDAGVEFVADRQQFDAIRADIEVALQRLRGVSVKVRSFGNQAEEEQKRNRATAAAVDPGFQSFLANVLVPRGPSDS